MAKPPQKKQKNGLTQEQEIQIGLEMIPMFKAKEEEAQLKFDKLQAVKSQLDQFKDEMGMPRERVTVQPLITTSFMPNRKVKQSISTDDKP